MAPEKMGFVLVFELYSRFLENLVQIAVSKLLSVALLKQTQYWKT